MKSFCLVGDVMVDVTMTNPVKMRMGGIMHAARACWALGIPYHLRYISPSYLTRQTEHYANEFGADSCEQIGSVEGCPNVIVVREATEAGSQGYEFLLRDEYKCSFVTDLRARIPEVSDVVVYPGSYDLREVLRAVGGVGDISVDVANWDGRLADLKEFGIATAISSTSSAVFLGEYGGSVTSFARDCESISRRLVFKENRGGSTIFSGGVQTQIGAHLRPIAHSVGVGDVYNIAYLSMCRESSDQIAGNFASRIAAEYAATTYPDEFKLSADAVCAMPDAELSVGQGVRVPWNARSSINIYIAAPDFDYNDRTRINAVADSLKYHNFRPRLPVRENGQANEATTRAEKLGLFQSDVELLYECSIVVAVLLDADPGTLIEIGMALAVGKPVVVFDPLHLAKNVMLECGPNEVCDSLDTLISAVFVQAAMLTNHE